MIQDKTNKQKESTNSIANPRENKRVYKKGEVIMEKDRAQVCKEVT